MKLTEKRLREVLEYSPLGGRFYWREARGPSKAGAVAGCYDRGEGYWRITIDGTMYAAHRLAWLYCYGSMPERIDHINGTRTDNRLANLREASRSQNAQNVHRPHCDNASGFLGVSRNKRRSHWTAQISAAGRQRYLGSFDTPEAANAAYIAAKEKLHERA